MAGVVWVVGSINMDYLIRVERLPAAGETVLAIGMERQGGGKGANQAVAAARDGAEVALVGAVGADDEGASSLAELAGERVDVGGVAMLEGHPTGRAFVVVDESGENEIVVVPGANSLLDRSIVESALATRGRGRARHPSGGRVFLVGFEIPDPAVVASALLAQERGDVLVVNPAPARPIPEALLACRPILMPNEREVTALVGNDSVERAGLALAAASGNWVIVTLGRGGALLVHGSELARVNGYPVSAVDTTGAGDAFSGVFASGLASGLDVPQAARRANAAAALSVRAQGARRGMPRRSETDRFLDEEVPR